MDTPGAGGVLPDTPYDITNVEGETDTEAATRARLRVHETERLLALVSAMLVNFGFKSCHVYYLLTCLTTGPIDKFSFTNSKSEVITEANISLVSLLMITLYTCPSPSDKCGRCLSQILKEALRDIKAEDVMKLKNVITTLDIALESLPPYISEEALFRGQNVRIQGLEVGGNFYMTWFASFSRDVRQALDFTDGQIGTLFVLRSPKSGADIQFASYVKYEKEVLYPRNTRFVVLGVFVGKEANMDVPELKSVTIGNELTVIVIAEAPTHASGP